MAWSPPITSGKAPRSVISRMSSSIAKKLSGSLSTCLSPTSTKQGFSARSTPSSEHKLADPQCSARRINSGAAAAHDLKLELASDRIPTNAISLLLSSSSVIESPGSAPFAGWLSYHSFHHTPPLYPLPESSNKSANPLE